MECQSLLSGKKKKEKYSKCCSLKILPRMLSINIVCDMKTFMSHVVNEIKIKA